MNESNFVNTGHLQVTVLGNKNEIWGKWCLQPVFNLRVKKGELPHIIL